VSDARTLPVLGPVAVLGLFAGACALPAAYYQGKFLEEGVSAYGFSALLFGWSACIVGASAGIAWFANPALVMGLFYQSRRRFSAAARWAAAATGLALLPLAELLFDWSGSVRWWPNPALVFVREYDGVVAARAELRAGYFVWLTAHGVLLGVAVVCWYQRPGAAADPDWSRIGSEPIGPPAGAGPSA
jgi:hypothetical protein